MIGKLVGLVLSEWLPYITPNDSRLWDTQSSHKTSIATTDLKDLRSKRLKAIRKSMQVRHRI